MVLGYYIWALQINHDDCLKYVKRAIQFVNDLIVVNQTEQIDFYSTDFYLTEMNNETTTKFISNEDGINIKVYWHCMFICFLILLFFF